MALVAQLQSYGDPGEQRGSRRRVLRLQIAVSANAASGDVLVHNLSQRGLLLETARALQPGDTLVVELPEAGVIRAEVIWSRNRFAGCSFEAPISAAAVSAALLCSEPKAQPARLAEGVAEPAWDRDFASATESQFIKVLAIVCLAIACVIATLFIAALLTAPFSVN